MLDELSNSSFTGVTVIGTLNWLLVLVVILNKLCPESNKPIGAVYVPSVFLTNPGTSNGVIVTSLGFGLLILNVTVLTFWFLGL